MKKIGILLLTVTLLLISCSKQKQEEPTWYTNDSLASLTVNDQSGEETFHQTEKKTATVEVKEQTVTANAAPQKEEEPVLPEFSTFVQNFENNGYDLSYLVGKYIFSWGSGYSQEYIEISYNEAIKEYEITWYRHVDFLFVPGFYDIDENGMAYERDELNWEVRNKGPFETIKGIIKHDVEYPYRMHIEKMTEDSELPSDVRKYTLITKKHFFPNESLELGEITIRTNGNPKGHYYLESDLALYQEWRESQKK